MTFTYEAKGDGNCAFNAFALYLADATQNGDYDGDSVDSARVKRQENVIALFREAELIGEKDQWNDLKQYIKKQAKKEQLDALQVSLAKVLRSQSVKLISKTGDANFQIYINHTTPALLAAYEDYKIHGTSRDVKNDDIFRRHDFIANKFFTFKEKSASETEIKEWWANEGATKFLEAMGKQGEEAGDAELVPLAVHYRLNFKFARKDGMPVTLTQNHFGEIPRKDLDEMKFIDNFSFQDEKEKISGKAALLRYLSNADVIVGKPSSDKADYQILVQNKDEVMERLKQSKDKNNKPCPEEVITAFVGIWQNHVKPTDVKSMTLRNDYAAHWNYEADRESSWLAPLKIAVKANLPESTPVKKLSEVRNFYYDFLKDRVRELKVGEPDANGRIEITGKINNQAFDLQVTQSSVTTKSTHPDALKLLVEATAKRIAEEGLPKTVSVDTSDAETMNTIIAECKKHEITISNLAEVKKKIAELEAAKKAEQAKPAMPAVPSEDSVNKMLEQLGKGPTSHT
jgi:hypothetical protein